MARFDYGGYGFRGFRPYVPVERRVAQAQRQVAKLKKRGRAVDPVVIDRKGRSIARTFWGQAWCTNLEAYSDFSNRLPRGRAYARNGSVVDLQIGGGRVTSLVQGRDLYEIEISVKPLAAKRWKGIVSECAGAVGSLVELLRGKLSDEVMQVVTRPGTGLFPAPVDISMRCSCPDWAVMCKHVAASLYGVGARLDERPELLFTLRGIDPAELVSEAATGGALGIRATAPERTLAANDLSSLFGVEIDDGPALPRAQARPVQKRAARRSNGAPTNPPTAVDGAARHKPRPEPEPIRNDATPLETRLLAFVVQNPGLRIEQIAQALGTSTRELALPVRRLLADGRLRTHGTRRATRYLPTRRSMMVRTQLRTVTALGRLERRRRSPGEIDEVAERLLAEAKARPGQRIEHIALRMGVPSRELTLAMKKLLAARRVKRAGQRRATRYFPS